MRRREFIAALGGAVAWPLTVRGQEVPKVRRVGYVAAGTASTGNQFLRDAFLSGMRELGYVEGQNFHFEVRFWGDDQRVLPDLVKDLVRAKAEVIVAPSSASVRAAQAVAPTTPIVFIVVADPVGSGDIVSFARPQTNATGITAMTPEIAVKRLELLKEAVPAAARIAVLSNSTSPAHPGVFKAIESAAALLAVSVRNFEGSGSTDDLDHAFGSMTKWRADAALHLTDGNFLARRQTIVALAAMHRLPLCCDFRQMAEAGCLMAYSTDLEALFYRAATYVDQILKGARPGDLPVEQPAKFKFVVNLKTAKALGLDIPPSLLARADEVIE